MLTQKSWLPGNSDVFYSGLPCSFLTGFHSDFLSSFVEWLTLWLPQMLAVASSNVLTEWLTRWYPQMLALPYLVLSLNINRVASPMASINISKMAQYVASSIARKVASSMVTGDYDGFLNG